MITVLPCSECGGEGRIFKSRYGGNDPDVWDAGPCEACNGTGEQVCVECGKHPAITAWPVATASGTPKLTYFVCEACNNEWLKDQAA